MKIHFVAAVDGNQKQYHKIVNLLKSYGHALVTDHYLTRTIDQIKAESEDESKKFFVNSSKWIKNSDLVIFETTKSDVSIGYEMSLVFQYQKPLVILFREGVGDEPFALKGVFSDSILVNSYTDSNLEKVILDSIEFASQKKEIRFNLLLSPDLNEFLNRTSKKQNLPKSQIVRNLIKQYQRELELDKSSF